MTQEVSETQEIHALRAEVKRLRVALERHQRQSPSTSPSPFEVDHDLPGLAALWRGERGLGWQLFVQAALTINALLMLVAGIAIVH
jgi:hypothetical protein